MGEEMRYQGTGEPPMPLTKKQAINFINNLADSGVILLCGFDGKPITLDKMISFKMEIWMNVKWIEIGGEKKR